MFTDCKDVDNGGKEPVNTVANSLHEFGISHTFFLTQASRFHTVTNDLNKEGTIAYEIDIEYCIIDSKVGNEINY